VKIGQTIGSIFKAVLLCGCIYGIVKWEFIKPQGGDGSDFAEKACVDEIGHRLDVSTARLYAVNETDNGYVVRVSVRLARGTTAKVYCLTNAHGGIKEITIEER
jgi:hypothetical protein